ncbi:MAG TPA: hypothetical protein DEF42_15800 [Desulfosporosinus sp.]|nr:hypothetical protein [Desulfosporosinus sp.]
MQFGQYIKEQRLQFGISSRKLSEKVGKSSSYISSIEKGLYKPDFDMALKIFEELRIEISDDTILDVLRDLGIESPRMPKTKWDSKLKASLEKLTTQMKNLDAEPDYQELYEDRQKEQIRLLNFITDQIEADLSNYPRDYKQCSESSVFEQVEKFLTTFTGLMLTNEEELFYKFYDLMKLPLHKLNPLQFQKLIDYAGNLIEYEYVFESGENSKTQNYPHYRVKYKEK